MVGCIVTHVPYPNKLEAAPVHPEDVIAYRAEDGALYDLCTSLQVPKPLALLEVLDQVNKSELCK